MKITIFTLFPKIFNSFLTTSIIKRAIDKKKCKIEVVNFRQFANDKHQTVDDKPYGGGGGMVLKIEPIVKAIKKYKKKNTKIILLTPQGNVFTQATAIKFSKFSHVILIAGHYEGFDERLNNFIDYQISIGDYVLTGGEIPAMVICESVIRLLKGVISQQSLVNESFNNNLLDYPNYTKPTIFAGHSVPDVLLSGNHQKITEWRKKQQILKTKKNRPDILKK